MPQPPAPATIWIHVKTRGLFITFEGMDGSGKTTQMHRLAARLRGMGRTVIETVEPGGPPIAMKIRRILLDSANQELSPRGRAAALLRIARAECRRGDPAGAGARRRSCSPTASRIRRWSIRGTGADSGPTRCAALDRVACRGLKPDLTILVDVDAEASLARARARNEAEPHCETRMDDQSLEFHRKVYDAYHALAAAEPERVKMVNGRAGYRRHRSAKSGHCERLCLRTSGATRRRPRRSSR